MRTLTRKIVNSQLQPRIVQRTTSETFKLACCRQSSMERLICHPDLSSVGSASVFFQNHRPHETSSSPCQFCPAFDGQFARKSQSGTLRVPTTLRLLTVYWSSCSMSMATAARVSKVILTRQPEIDFDVQFGFNRLSVEQSREIAPIFRRLQGCRCKERWSA